MSTRAHTQAHEHTLTQAQTHLHSHTHTHEHILTQAQTHTYSHTQAHTHTSTHHGRDQTLKPTAQNLDTHFMSVPYLCHEA